MGWRVLRTIKSQILVVTVLAIIIAMTIAATFGVIAIRDIGTTSSNQSLLLLCEAGEKNLDAYFKSVAQSVEMVSSFVDSDLTGLEEDELQAHLERTREIFLKAAEDTSGVLTFYYRIDPAVSTTQKGFWYVNLDGEGFKEHEVTDITLYDVEDTSKLVWFTVPRATGESVWLPPYITDNLDTRVISYNVPVYYEGRFVGVVGIEIDYSTMAEQVDNITLYDNGYAFINDADGTIVYHPHISGEELDKNHPKVPDGLLSDDTFIRYTFEGVERQAVWLPLDNGMRLNVTVPVAEINASWQEWIIQILVIFGVVLIVFIIVIMQYTKRITQPLHELTNVAKQVDAGNYDVSIDYDGEDEVGSLARTFNHLVENLGSYIKDLNDLAYADALTSVHNKGAFDLYMRDLQERLNDPEDSPNFAVCVFDCNGLKQINDEFGHDKGDAYLKTACTMICEVFDRSPVFRIGGDEFAAVLMTIDFEKRDELLSLFDESCAEKRETAEARWEQVSVARGMAVYDADEDETAGDTVRRADRLMYENKWAQKGRVGQE